jgi:protein TonB
VKKAAPRPKPPVVAKPAPEPERADQPEAEPPAPVPALSPPAAPPTVATVEPAPSPPSPSAEQLEAMTREQYRMAVIDAARRHNRYPPLARENNWEGEVRVRMEIGADGRVSLGIEKSSGHPVLDRQAMEMFRRAQAQVALPPSLRGKALLLQLRAIYNLKDQVSG